jgi:hypothetical protein
MKMAPFDRVADQSSAFRADLKAQGKRRRERLSSLTSAPPLRRRNDLLPPLRVEELSLADLVGPARNVRRQEPAQIREVAASIAGRARRQKNEHDRFNLKRSCSKVGGCRNRLAKR